LHFSHIGLTDGRTFMIPFGVDPGGTLWLPVRPPLRSPGAVWCHADARGPKRDQRV
jgi:hypothetical protein